MRLLYTLLIFLILISYGGAAQTYTHGTTLPAVVHDGFYRIAVSPEIGTYLNTDYSNVRLIDTVSGKEVPFLPMEEAPVYSRQQFHSYTILQKKIDAGCCTSLIFKNDDRHPINNIRLEIKNADVVKEATLLGSDDQHQWYALKEQFQFHAINNEHETSLVNIVNFPLSNYLYYSLQIEDSTTAPLNILSAGFYDVQTEAGHYTPLTDLTYMVSDSVKEKKTYVSFSFGAQRFVDKIELSFSGAPYYLREAFLYEPRERIAKNGKREIRHYLLKSYELSSTHASTLSFSENTKLKNFLMVIKNDDNPALTLDSAKGYQLNRYLIAWLKAGTSYSLKFAKNLTPPTYDLVFFKDSIPDSPPILHTGNILPVTVAHAYSEKKESLFIKRFLIWMAIIAVIASLGFMSVKMIHETAKQKENM